MGMPAANAVVVQVDVRGLDTTGDHLGRPLVPGQVVRSTLGEGQDHRSG